MAEIRLLGTPLIRCGLDGGAGMICRRRLVSEARQKSMLNFAPSVCAVVVLPKAPW